MREFLEPLRSRRGASRSGVPIGRVRRVNPRHLLAWRPGEGRGRPPALWARRLAATAWTLAGGAVLEFFLDPRSGKRRRRLVRDRAMGAARSGRRRFARQTHYEVGKVVGRVHAIAHRNRSAPELDDVGLVRKVESELFRDRTVPKGQISINADRGIVVLRGALEERDQIHRIEGAVRKIAGARDVENLLHPSGSPAPSSRPHGNHRTAPRAA
jgi:hypothetical protein